MFLDKKDMPDKRRFPTITPLIDKGLYVTKDDLFYTNERVGCIIVVPKRFVSDGASIPRWLWSFYGHPFSPKYLRAVILHDWMYVEAIYDKGIADRIFYDILLEDGVGRRRAWLMYKAVKSFGKGNYK